MDDGYERGVRDGKIESLEGMLRDHKEILMSHEVRLRSAERILYALIGVYALVQFTPALRKFLGVE